MDSDLIIERLGPDADLAPILEIERASFSHPWTPDMFRWELRNWDVAGMWVLRTPDRRVVAFCCVSQVLDELHINNVAVAPDVRRQGFARRLLEHVIERALAEGVTRATLEVRRSNAGALKLYERLGFKLGGVRPAYYANPVEDALILWRFWDDSAAVPPGSTG
jgi:ribosomal-protein-alanine N-acetyltransferase